MSRVLVSDSGESAIRRVLWDPLVLGGLLGFLVIAAFVIGSRASAHESGDGVFQAHHRPPLLVSAGESVILVYDTVCAWSDSRFRQGLELCHPSGVVHVEPTGASSYETFDLERVEGTPLLAVQLPSSISEEGFRYYAVINDEVTGQVVTLPDGPQARHQVWIYDSAVPIDLGEFEALAAGEVVVSGSWGSSIGEFGFAGGDEAALVGPGSFTFLSDGTLQILDQVNRRIVNPLGSDQSPGAYEVAHTGGIADLVSDQADRTYMLDGGSLVPNQVSLLLADGGLAATALLTGIVPEKLHPVDEALFVHDALQSRWFPVFREGVPLEPAGQRAESVAGRPLSSAEVEAWQNMWAQAGGGPAHSGIGAGAQLVVAATGERALVAIVDGPVVATVWSVTSPWFIGEVQLAELHQSYLSLVLRTWVEGTAVFEMLALSPDGMVDRVTIDADSWAQGAVLGLFKFGPEGLYYMRTSEDEFTILRFELKGATPHG